MDDTPPDNDNAPRAQQPPTEKMGIIRGLFLRKREWHRLQYSLGELLMATALFAYGFNKLAQSTEESKYVAVRAKARAELDDGNWRYAVHQIMKGYDFQRLDQGDPSFSADVLIRILEDTTLTSERRYELLQRLIHEKHASVAAVSIKKGDTPFSRIVDDRIFGDMGYSPEITNLFFTEFDAYIDKDPATALASLYWLTAYHREDDRISPEIRSLFLRTVDACPKEKRVELFFDFACQGYDKQVTRLLAEMDPTEKEEAINKVIFGYMDPKIWGPRRAIFPGGGVESLPLLLPHISSESSFEMIQIMSQQDLVGDLDVDTLSKLYQRLSVDDRGEVLSILARYGLRELVDDAWKTATQEQKMQGLDGYVQQEWRDLAEEAIEYIIQEKVRGDEFDGLWLGGFGSGNQSLLIDGLIENNWGDLAERLSDHQLLGEKDAAKVRKRRNYIDREQERRTQPPARERE